MKRRRKWNFIPRISYCNFKKKYGADAIRGWSWFAIRRYWGGRIINVSIKHRVLSFDFRHSFLQDMISNEEYR